MKLKIFVCFETINNYLFCAGLPAVICFIIS
jgi:hypothetical protein